MPNAWPPPTLESHAAAQAPHGRGFKSIRALEDFDLRALNVLIGANGAGKSNFIGVFRMLAELAEQRLQLYVREQDGRTHCCSAPASAPPNSTPSSISAATATGFALVPAADKLVFSREETWFDGDYGVSAQLLGSGHEEARLREVTADSFAPYVRPAIARWRVYHFHDTGTSAPVRQAQPVRDNLRLKADAGNLAPFIRLLREQHPNEYRRIVETVRLVAPFFGDFVYRREAGERVELEWTDADDPDTVRSPRQLSDGTLRFIAIATLLLQPAHLQPDTILIDEPELGLHPTRSACWPR